MNRAMRGTRTFASRASVSDGIGALTELQDAFSTFHQRLCQSRLKRNQDRVLLSLHLRHAQTVE
jgi:hypothetical protein